MPALLRRLWCRVFDHDWAFEFPPGGHTAGRCRRCGRYEPRMIEYLCDVIAGRKW